MVPPLALRTGCLISRIHFQIPAANPRAKKQVATASIAFKVMNSLSLLTGEVIVLMFLPSLDAPVA